MGKCFRSSDVNQALLLPPSLHDWLPEKHLARFLVDVVDALDLGAIYESYDGLTGQTVVSTENRVGCGAFGHAISPQFTPSEARSAEISCCDIHLTIFIASEIPTFVSYSPLRRRLTTNHARDCAQVYVAHRKAGQKRLGTSPLATTRSQPGNPWEVAITPMVLPCHEPSLLSTPAARCGSQGRTKIFFDCACATVAMRLSGSVALVIAGSDIAVRGAEPQPGRNSSA